jgi:hypothetical protein
MPAESVLFRPRSLTLPSLASGVAFAAGALAPFTIAFIGEVPVGEVVLIALAGWALLCLCLRHGWPSPLLGQRYCHVLLIADVVALVAYVATDLYRGSLPHDYLRGWSRLLCLALNVIGVAYLFGRSPRHFLAFAAGQCVGLAAHALLFTPLFGDNWKFGFALPLSIFVLALVPAAGPVVTAAAALALGGANFILDYRSEGGICILVGIFSLLQLFRPRARAWLAPFLALAATALVLTVYARTENVGRADRSNLERQAMMTVAAQAFLRSPLVGYGSWFSRTRVYDDFITLRAQLAQEEQLPGFAAENTDPGNIAFHSQILVALAEGGLFGGAFFIVYGWGLWRALRRLAFTERWSRYAPLALFFLISALWDLIFSPFSGEQRITIAEACGLILLIFRPAGLAGLLANRTP